MTLTSSYLGLDLAHPFILGASPFTGRIDYAKRLEDGGCAAIVMHSLFEEQITNTVTVASMAPNVAEFDHARAQYPGPEEFPLDPYEYLEQIRRIKAAVAIPVIASLNGTSAASWLKFATLMEEAGADAIELNIYDLATDPHDSAFAIEARLEGIVRDVKRLIRIPVAVKLSPFFTAFANMAASLDRAGADALVLFNRFYQPDVDVERLQVTPNLRLSTSPELLLRIRWIAILSGRVKAALAITGGVQSPLEGIKALLAGAHVVQQVSAILQHGPTYFRVMVEGLRYWMARHQYESIADFRGHLDLRHSTDPASFERANYLRILQSWKW